MGWCIVYTVYSKHIWGLYIHSLVCRHAFLFKSVLIFTFLFLLFIIIIMPSLLLYISYCACSHDHFYSYFIPMISTCKYSRKCAMCYFGACSSERVAKPIFLVQCSQRTDLWFHPLPTAGTSVHVQCGLWWSLLLACVAVCLYHKCYMQYNLPVFSSNYA